jgi:hypothetical protein
LFSKVAVAALKSAKSQKVKKKKKKKKKKICLSVVNVRRERSIEGKHIVDETIEWCAMRDQLRPFQSRRPNVKERIHNTAFFMKKRKTKKN